MSQDKRVHLYFDDSGSRQPDHVPHPVKQDGMDCFALGGILIFENDVDSLIKKHKSFLKEWDIEYPLHSTKIRGRRERFSWLKLDPDKEARFLGSLTDYLLSLPVLAIACVVHRPGYVERYSERFDGKPWLLCKTAFSILIERAAKYAKQEEAKLEIFFEEAGKTEDRAIKQYMKELKATGMPFSSDSSAKYSGLCADDFRSIVLGDPRGQTKLSPLMQVSDLFLYPIVKGGYDSSYRAYHPMIFERLAIYS